MADEPVSRILYGAALASLRRDDHSSSPGLAAGIERPTRGFILPCRLRRTEGSASFARKHSVSRASSPLLFGLAPRGVFRAPDVATGAVGSYPTFSPLPAMRTIRRHPEGFPPGYHRDTLRWRFVLCGTVREPLKRPPRKAAATTAPLALPGALPFTLRAEGSKGSPPDHAAPRLVLRSRGVVSGLSSRLP